MPSQVKFRGRYINVRDNEIVFLLNMLLKSLPATETDDWVRRVRERWEFRISGCGFGLYELDLEQLVVSANEKQRMLQVLEQAKNAMNAHGQYIKKEWLNTLPYREGIYLHDPETSQFVGKLEEIEDLLMSTRTSN